MSVMGTSTYYIGLYQKVNLPNNDFQCNWHGAISDTFGCVMYDPAQFCLLGMNVTREGNTVTVG